MTPGAADAGIVFDIQRLSLHDGPGIRTCLVRVSGYSAGFTDLTPDMQKEIIRRRTIGA